MNEDLTSLPGIGPKTEEAFKKAGIENISGLLEFYPRDFEIFSPPCSCAQAAYKTFAAVKGAFTDVPFTRSVNGKPMTSAQFKDEAGACMRVVWFNTPYIKKQICPGTLYVIRGRVNRKYNVISMSQPAVYPAGEYEKKLGVMQPVYPRVKGVSNAAVSRALKAALNTPAFDEMADCDVIAPVLRRRYGLLPYGDAVRNMHFPSDAKTYSQACRRISFEEIFLFILSLKSAEGAGKKESGVVVRRCEGSEKFIKKLPFALTPSQKKVMAEIEGDMESGFAMNRLLQGDVGSGKTVVALYALLNAALCGYQGILMAPTQILAKQHEETARALFKAAGVNVHTALLTGSMSALERKAAYEAIEDGRVSVIIGTHAVFQEKVKYHNLGLVITDEQHRFGLSQRKAAAGKGCFAHLLVMSATPIPRTLALILYGGMDISVLGQVPKGRLPVKNAVVDESYRPNAYRFIEREVRKGRQAYIICPMVDYSEGLEACNVTDYTQMLKDIMPEDITIGMLHGRMKADEKEKIMEDFASGKIGILVSTTVIEVGVDVPNASVMMVENADRFGLAQLHQLRGRVGRSDIQSYCIFVSSNASKEAKERLEILRHSNDGFEIAAKDLSLRGPGEFTGERQSGAFSFKYFDVSRDSTVALEAMEAADAVLSGDVSLSSEEKRILSERMNSFQSDIIL